MRNTQTRLGDKARIAVLKGSTQSSRCGACWGPEQKRPPLSHVQSRLSRDNKLDCFASLAMTPRSARYLGVAVAQANGAVEHWLPRRRLPIARKVAEALELHRRE